MKKKLLILPLIALMALPGCKSNKNRNKKGDVVNNAVLKANTKEIKKNIFSGFDLETAFNFDYESTSYEVSNGFTILTKDGKTSFFSAIKKANILEINSTDTYKTYPSDVAGGFISVVTSEGVSVLDALGNTLVENSKRTYSSLEITSGITEKDIYYAEVKFDDISLYFHYDDKGVATVHSTNMGDDYDSGSLINGIGYMLLDDFGHRGYQMIKNSSRYIVFDNKGNEISSFTDPNADAEFFVGDYLIYQNSIKLDNNNNNYDFISQSGERYSLETYRINYMNAKKEAINVSYLLSTGENDIHSFYNAKGVYAYAYANLKTISDKKILSNTLETYIIDSSGNLHDNVTGINLGAFERIGSNYYNTDSKTIYDGNLNELSILTNTNPIKIDNAEIIVCSVEGKYGAVNQNGQVVLPFEYDNIYTSYLSADRALVVENGVNKVVSFNTNNQTHTDVREIENGSITYFGCGVYSLNNKYFSLVNPEPSLLKSDESSSVEVFKAISYVISVAKLFTLETNGTQVTYYDAPITIAH